MFPLLFSSRKWEFLLQCVSGLFEDWSSKIYAELAMEINPYVLKTKWWIANNIERFPKFHINNVHYKKRLKY